MLKSKKTKQKKKKEEEKKTIWNKGLGKKDVLLEVSVHHRVLMWVWYPSVTDTTGMCNYLSNRLIVQMHLLLAAEVAVGK